MNEPTEFPISHITSEFFFLYKSEITLLLMKDLFYLINYGKLIISVETPFRYYY